MTQHAKTAQRPGNGKAGHEQNFWTALPEMWAKMPQPWSAMPALAPWGDGYGHAWENYLQSGAQLMQSSLDIGKGIFEFSQGRLKSNMDSLTAMAGCKNPDDMLACQKRSAEQAVNQYLEEAHKVSNQMNGAVRETVSRILNHSGHPAV